MNRYSVLLLFLIVFFSCKKGKNNPHACNGSSTRRAIKLCVDNLANEIDTLAISAPIDSLGEIDVVEADSETERQPVEKKVFTITGVVDKYKKYRDGDYHIRLKDANDHYIICEAPNPTCNYAVSSPFINSFIKIRDFIESNDIQEGQELTITGVAFIDINHHYNRKQADNNLELHPILSIKF